MLTVKRHFSLGFLQLPVKRDTQKERTTKSRNSWGAEAVRVQVEQPVLHEPTVISQWGTADAPARSLRSNCCRPSLCESFCKFNTDTRNTFQLLSSAEQVKSSTHDGGRDARVRTSVNETYRGDEPRTAGPARTPHTWDSTTHYLKRKVCSCVIY